MYSKHVSLEVLHSEMSSRSNERFQDLLSWKVVTEQEFNI